MFVRSCYARWTARLSSKASERVDLRSATDAANSTSTSCVRGRSRTITSSLTGAVWRFLGAPGKRPTQGPDILDSQGEAVINDIRQRGENMKILPVGLATGLLFTMAFWNSSVSWSQQQSEQQSSPSASGTPTIEKTTLPDGRKELKIIGTDEEIEEILDYIANGGTEEPDKPQQELAPRSEISGGFLPVSEGFLLVRSGWTRLTQSVRNKINNILPMYEYCAVYRKNRQPGDPPIPITRETMSSRLGADSVKARVAAMLAGGQNGAIISVTRGACH